MIRIQLPDTPGSLGSVATAMGTADADISAIEIVEQGDDYVIDDFMLTLPPTTMPDTLVSACDMLDGVHVLWLSRHQENWSIESDISALNRMSADPQHSAEILCGAVPVVFHTQWSALFDADEQVIISTALAPEFTPEGIARLTPMDCCHVAELEAGWMPGWGDTIIAAVPLSGGRCLVAGRQGGPEFLPSELNRLQHMAALAN
ncbi:amino acid-binding protein [Cutibacterium equinum]|uniref:Amino acid-binding protein n=1 Tax=Cutibacterium equinum TaxID=3016342 RepID=A0ABY7R0L1_9ACTN|nr:amino acid-binding protein [Cutibacterium equinum]WCC80831.1 amino acid-binding protein [Cutibacterium equinum]